MNRTILEAKDIHKVYRQATGELPVLKGINLSVKEAEILTIVGPSGAGKSTLLHILGALNRPTKGTVVLENEDIYRLNDDRLAGIRNKKVGFVFQFYHLLPEFTALENVMLPVIISKKESRAMKEVQESAQALLGQVGLGKRLGHKPHQLSGGEQQRVAIARALIHQPRIVFCDEPTGNLDSASGAAIIDLLLRLNREKNQTVVIVTHDEAIAARSHNILHIRDGQLGN